jgi:hypothetical protein
MSVLGKFRVFCLGESSSFCWSNYLLPSSVLATIFAVIVISLAASNISTTEIDFSLGNPVLYVPLVALALAAGALTICTLPVLCDFIHKYLNYY